MDRKNVVWWVFDPPTNKEQQTLERMRMPNLVWVDEDLAYAMTDKKYTEPAHAPELIDKLRDFANKHNAASIVGFWNDAMYQTIRAMDKTHGVSCYCIVTVGYRFKEFRLIGKI